MQSNNFAHFAHFAHFGMVFPGQGSQSIGMLNALAAKYAMIHETFREASQVLHYDLWHTVQHGPLEKLNQTAVTQPALLTASVALWRVWLSLGGARPVVMSGHSLGEYSALVCANALDFKDAVHLVAERGRYMQEAVPEGVGAMAAIIGLELQVVSEACSQAAENETVSPANINGENQIVVAGHKKAVERAMDICKKQGAKLVKLLDVSVPSHCMLMQPAAERLGILLDKITWRQPDIAVVHNIDAEIHTDITQIKQALFKQLAYPVQWVACVRRLAGGENINKVNKILECGPGKVLTGLNKRIVADIPTLPLTEPELLIQALETQAA